MKVEGYYSKKSFVSYFKPPMACVNKNAVYLKDYVGKEVASNFHSIFNKVVHIRRPLYYGMIGKIVFIGNQYFFIYI